MKQRIWELDALRGLCILGMILVHFVYDISTFSAYSLQIPPWFYPIAQYGHMLFVLISGISVTLGSKCVKRGLIVYLCGMIITIVTLVLDYGIGLGRVRIWFGILHLLGVCMMVYPLFRKLPSWALAIIGVSIMLLGHYFTTFTVDVNFLFPLGLRSGKIFTGADFFPIFPGLGTFLVGAALGKSLYRKKQSLLPNAPQNFFLLRFFRFVGRNSLMIYMLHQPIVFAIVAILFPM